MRTRVTLLVLLLLATVFHTTVSAMGAICEHADGTAAFESLLELQSCHESSTTADSDATVSGTDCVDTRLPSSTLSERSGTRKLEADALIFTPLYYLPSVESPIGIRLLLPARSTELRTALSEQALSSLATIILVI